VRIIVPAAAGGGIDITARLIGQLLSERLGQQFIIEDRGGGGFTIGTEMVVHAPPDGYTLLLASLANAVNATLYEKLNYNFVRDIAPVAGIMGVSNVVEIHPSRMGRLPRCCSRCSRSCPRRRPPSHRPSGSVDPTSCSTASGRQPRRTRLRITGHHPRWCLTTTGTAYRSFCDRGQYRWLLGNRRLSGRLQLAIRPHLGCWPRSRLVLGQTPWPPPMKTRKRSPHARG